MLFVSACAHARPQVHTHKSGDCVSSPVSAHQEVASKRMACSGDSSPPLSPVALLLPPWAREHGGQGSYGMDVAVGALPTRSLFTHAHPASAATVPVLPAEFLTQHCSLVVSQLPGGCFLTLTSVHQQRGRAVTLLKCVLS